MNHYFDLFHANVILVGNRTCAKNRIGKQPTSSPPCLNPPHPRHSPQARTDYRFNLDVGNQSSGVEIFLLRQRPIIRMKNRIDSSHRFFAGLFFGHVGDEAGCHRFVPEPVLKLESVKLPRRGLILSNSIVTSQFGVPACGSRQFSGCVARTLQSWPSLTSTRVRGGIEN